MSKLTLVSPRVFSKAEAEIDAQPLGELSLKGFHRPVLAYNVLGSKVS
jgi:class 3 adenylate cyclase